MKFKFVKSILILSCIAYGKTDDLIVEEIPSNIKTITKTVIYTSKSTPYKPYKGSAFNDVTPCNDGDDECFNNLINECTPEIQHECMASNSIVIQAKCRQLSKVCEDIWYPKATTTTTTTKPSSHKPYEGSAFDDITPCNDGDDECFNNLINECTPKIQHECMASNSIVIQAKCRQLSDVCEDIWYPKPTSTTSTTKPTSHKPYEGSAFDDVTPCDENDDECFSGLINECTPEIQHECMASNSIVIQAKCRQLSKVCEDIWYPKSTTSASAPSPTSHKPYEGSAFDDVTPCNENDDECFSKLINECTPEIQYECMASNSLVIQAKCRQLSEVCEDIWYPKPTSTTTTTKPTSHKPYEGSAFDDVTPCDDGDEECFNNLINECTPEIQHECMASNSIVIQAKCRQLSEVCEDIWYPKPTSTTTITKPTSHKPYEGSAFDDVTPCDDGDNECFGRLINECTPEIQHECMASNSIVIQAKCRQLSDVCEDIWYPKATSTTTTTKPTSHKPYEGSAFDDVTPCDENDEECFSGLINECTPEIQHECMASNSIVIQAKCRQLSDVCEDIWYPKATTTTTTTKPTSHKPYEGSAFNDVTPCDENDEECFNNLINECTPEIQHECMASNSIVIQAKCRQLSDVCEDIWYPKTTTTTTTTKPTSHKPYEGSAFDDVTPCDENDEECFNNLINECTPEIQHECMASNSIVIQAKCRQLSDVCEDIWYPKPTTTTTTTKPTSHKPYEGSAFDDVTPCDDGDNECFGRLINECTPEIQHECMASNSIVIQAKCRQLSDVCEDIWYPKPTTTTTTTKPTSHKPYEGSAFDDVTPCDDGDNECFGRLINECTPEIQYECMASNSIVIQAKCRQLSDICKDIWYPKPTSTTITAKPISHKPYEGSAFDDVTPCDENDEECFNNLINECTPEIQHECMASNSIVIQAKCRQLSDVCEDIWYPKATTTTTTTKPTSHKPYEGSAFDDVTPCDDGDNECFGRLINECTPEIQHECMASNSIVIQAKCRQLSDVCEDIWYPKATSTTTTTKPTSHKPYEGSAFDDVTPCDENDEECFNNLINECTPEIQHECMASNSIVIQAKCRQLSEVCEDIWNPKSITTTPTTTSVNNDSVTVSTDEKETATETVDMKHCASKWGQCGGIGYKGPTCCESGDCHEYNQWYSQCI